jgi:hypothetical protein
MKTLNKKEYKMPKVFHRLNTITKCSPIKSKHIPEVKIKTNSKISSPMTVF